MDIQVLLSQKVAGMTFKTRLPLIILGVISLAGFLSVQYYNRVLYLRGRNVLYPIGQVLGVEAISTNLEVDYSQQISTGNPEVFGASHGPRLEHVPAWDMLKDIGVTTLRRDINLQYEAPLTTTLPQYLTENYAQKNMANFNWPRLNETHQIFTNARVRGMKTMAATAYMPLWLSLNGRNNGLATNWDIYEDLVAKVYKYHRPYLDYFEISNEPDLKSFLDPTGTSLTRQEAYLELFLHTARAIKKVDKEANDNKKMLIGGGITSEPNQPSYLEALLQNEEAKSYLNFVSYHTYGYTEPTSKRTKEVLIRYDKQDLPIFITEWNQSSNTTEESPYHRGNLAITYTAEKLFDFLTEGYGGANYFTMSESDDNRPNTVFSVFGIYKMKNNRLTPFDQTKTWMVLSKMSRLGRGKSAIYRTSYDTSTNIKTLAFKNVDGKYGFAINNPTTKAVTVNVSLKNVDLSQETKLVAYEASLYWDAKNPKGSLTNASNQSQIKIFVSPMSLVSVIIN